MAAAPTGTITFLFTDIEGSARRWDEQPEAMREDLARHDAVLREAIERRGGSVFKTVGDAFLAAFRTAPAAFAAAVDGQRALAESGWGTSVRMALHTGTADERDGDYFGPTLNRTERLRAGAHGGQILLSAITAALLAGRVPDGIELRDLGVHRLRGLSEPERIYQAAVWGMRADFPPLALTEDRPSTLPVPLTSLVGREADIEQIISLLDTTRLVTLTGPGGVGKTRLAVAVAERLHRDYADGAVFVDLSALGDADLVVSTIAQVLGVREREGQTLVEALYSFLHEKRLLLVLDNFEQVLGAAPLLSGLLVTASGLSLPVTSRVVLRLASEQEYPVPTLPLPDPGARLASLAEVPSVALFVARARQVRPSLILTDANAAAVAEICTRLDGLRLALELAAARIRLLSPAALRARLHERLTLLVGGARDLPMRQRTLRSAMAWSYDLLSPPERTLFRRLAVFAGGCTLAAAEVVAAQGGELGLDALDGLTSLVDNSLLRHVERSSPGTESRFSMLETVREFGLEALSASGEATIARLTHAQYFLRVAREANAGLRGPDRALWRARLEEERDNLRAALSWARDTGDRGLGLRLCTALTWFWYTSEAPREGLGWVEAMLTLPGEAGPRLEGQGRHCGGLLAEAARDYERSLALAESAVPLRREADPQTLAYALLTLSLARHGVGDDAAAVDAARESVGLLEALGDRWGQSMALQNLGIALDRLGECDEALRVHEASIALRRQDGDWWGIVTGLVWILRILLRQEEFAAARGVAEEMLTIHRQFGEASGVIEALRHLATLAHYAGDDGRAVRLLEEALALHPSGSVEDTAFCQAELAYLAYRRGDEAEACARLTEAVHALHKIRARGGTARCLLYSAALAARRGQWRAVARLLAAPEGWPGVGPIHQADRHIREEYERLRGDATKILGDDAFAAIFAAGRGLSLDAAVALALESTQEPTAPP